MNNITKEDIREIFKEVVAEERKQFWVDAETHWIDHLFITSVRNSGEVVKRTALRVAVAATITGVIGWVILHLRS